MAQLCPEYHYNPFFKKAFPLSLPPTKKPAYLKNFGLSASTIARNNA